MYNLNVFIPVFIYSFIHLFKHHFLSSIKNIRFLISMVFAAAAHPAHQHVQLHTDLKLPGWLKWLFMFVDF